jgi:hypothetical protein
MSWGHRQSGVWHHCRCSEEGWVWRRMICSLRWSVPCPCGARPARAAASTPVPVPCAVAATASASGRTIPAAKAASGAASARSGATAWTAYAGRGLTYGDAARISGLGRPSVRAPTVSLRVDSAPPPDAWQRRAQEVAEEAHRRLREGKAKVAEDWLTTRGIRLETALAAGLGWLPFRIKDDATRWGRWDREEPVRVPVGIVIPWYQGDQLWRLNVRRLVGEPKCLGPAGNGNGLYGADGLWHCKVAVLVEGEFDALSVCQEAGDRA